MISYHVRKEEETKNEKLPAACKPSLLLSSLGERSAENKMSPDGPVTSFVYLQSACLDFMLIPMKHLPPQAWVGFLSAALSQSHVFLLRHRTNRDNVSSSSTQPRPQRDRASHVLYLTVSK